MRSLDWFILNKRMDEKEWGTGERGGRKRERNQSNKKRKLVSEENMHGNDTGSQIGPRQFEFPPNNGVLLSPGT